MTTQRFVLWDIDHTLVDGADLGPRIWGGAFERLAGVPVTRHFVPDGSTDPIIFRNLAALHEVPDRDWSDADIAAAYYEAYLAVEDAWHERARPKPAAHAATAALAADGTIVQSVLTGNVAANARGKLRALGLDTHLDFTIGAYGDDPHRVRGDLVPIARNRARDAYSHDFGPTNTILIGDTPRDVQAGHDGGAHVIAVATGVYPPDELAAAGADRVLTDLSGLPAAVTALFDESAA